MPDRIKKLKSMSSVKNLKNLITGGPKPQNPTPVAADSPPQSPVSPLQFAGPSTPYHDPFNKEANNAQRRAAHRAEGPSETSLKRAGKLQRMLGVDPALAATQADRMERNTGGSALNPSSPTSSRPSVDSHRSSASTDSGLDFVGGGNTKNTFYDPFKDQKESVNKARRGESSTDVATRPANRAKDQATSQATGRGEFAKQERAHPSVIPGEKGSARRTQTAEAASAYESLRAGAPAKIAQAKATIPESVLAKEAQLAAAAKKGPTAGGNQSGSKNKSKERDMGKGGPSQS